MGNLSSSEEAAFRILIAAKDAHFWYRLSAPPSSLILPEISVTLSRDYLTKAVILETHRLPMIPLKIRGNHGRSIAVWCGPISNPNRS